MAITYVKIDTYLFGMFSPTGGAIERRRLLPTERIELSTFRLQSERSTTKLSRLSHHPVSIQVPKDDNRQLQSFALPIELWRGAFKVRRLDPTQNRTANGWLTATCDNRFTIGSCV